MRSQTAVKLLFYLLKSIPVIILDSEIDGDKLNFSLACWDVGIDFLDQPNLLLELTQQLSELEAQSLIKVATDYYQIFTEQLETMRQ